ncbi:MAG TPA: sulfur oxidation c-type cytochrome SoxX [Casimicrobiaceae bacterium]
MRMLTTRTQGTCGDRARWRVALVIALTALMAGDVLAALVEFRIVGDGIPQALTSAPGSVERGRALVIAHESANCIVCHSVVDPGVRVSGNIGPALDGVGRRLSVAQLRLRVVDSMRVNAESAMPSYYRITGLNRVADTYRNVPVLDAQQVEDVVAWLASLTAP